ncbi:fumarylacetoacetate hydrolase family protein [Chlorobium ferrooxidans]|uniref:Fumarylacetoacetate (FAA) hydrolase n=1 Tax=Chlorobium ferrooxidans DSM 13031 TaxID=377431 RepID=Q0YQX0_9CHLB|nr:fumarylacetoacetate hydrolase family protein [Chlorobium ferrooxidans]EAT58702.1 Fumarylacetoacetate (FAA) hydrolase [Chlorobium ferrooxidans DSM 13031]
MENLILRNSIHPGAIYCVGKNYSDHALEMQQLEAAAMIAQSRQSAEPIIFMKPPTALETDGVITMPVFHGRPLSENMHYEAELVLLVGKSTDGCSIEEAVTCISGFGAGLDMTLRDEQLSAKKSGNPWLKSKGFRKSALISDFVPFTETQFPPDLEISLELNGKLVQQGAVSEMLHPPAMLIHYLSYLYGLRSGDLVFTGTPAGVGAVRPGDALKCRVSRPGAGSREVVAELQANVF